MSTLKEEPKEVNTRKSIDSLMDIKLLETNDAKQRLRAAVGKNKVFLSSRTTQNHAFFNTSAHRQNSMPGTASPLRLARKNLSAFDEFRGIKDFGKTQRISLKEVSLLSQGALTDARQEQLMSS